MMTGLDLGRSVQSGASAHLRRARGTVHAHRGPAWYCIQTKRGQESNAWKRLRRISDVEIVYPRIRSRQKALGGIPPSIEPFFPRYLFGRFSSGPILDLICGTVGVEGVVRFGRRWATVRDEEMRELKMALDAQGILERPRERLQLGVTVDFPSGLEPGFRALLRFDVPSAQRVRFLVNLLRRNV